MREIPILTYHGVEGQTQVGRSMTPGEIVYLLKQESFEMQMEFLADHDFQSLLIDDLIENPNGFSNQSRKSVCLTFDDGFSSDYSVVFPLLKKLQLRGTFFIVTSFVGNPGYVTWEQLREMRDNGMSIQSHSHSHPRLTQCTASEVSFELAKSKSLLEENLASPVHIFCVPFGHWQEEFTPFLNEYGYLALCTSQSGVNCPPYDLYSLKRLSMRRTDNIGTFTSFVNLERRALLMNRGKTAFLNFMKSGLGIERYNWVRTKLLEYSKDS